jgi:hypothetical protein
MEDEVRSETGPVASPFDVLEERLREIRREAGLGSAGSGERDRASDGPRIAAPAPVTLRRPVAGRSPSSGTVRRAPVWDLVLLGFAWAGLVALVVMALQAV